jgi:hypothetical protein
MEKCALSHYGAKLISEQPIILLLSRHHGRSVHPWNDGTNTDLLKRVDFGQVASPKIYIYIYISFDKGSSFVSSFVVEIVESNIIFR